MDWERAIACLAHRVACARKSAGLDEMGLDCGVAGGANEGGGRCWAMEVARLFTTRTVSGL